MVGLQNKMWLSLFIVRRNIMIIVFSKSILRNCKRVLFRSRFTRIPTTQITFTTHATFTHLLLPCKVSTCSLGFFSSTTHRLIHCKTSFIALCLSRVFDPPSRCHFSLLRRSVAHSHISWSASLSHGAYLRKPAAPPLLLSHFLFVAPPPSLSL